MHGLDVIIARNRAAAEREAADAAQDGQTDRADTIRRVLQSEPGRGSDPHPPRRNRMRFRSRAPKRAPVSPPPPLIHPFHGFVVFLRVKHATRLEALGEVYRRLDEWFAHDADTTPQPAGALMSYEVEHAAIRGKRKEERS